MDRSSEERSRFEKWWTTELLSGKSWTSADIDNMGLAWRAALEDRQEAAPNDKNCVCGKCTFETSIECRCPHCGSSHKNARGRVSRGRGAWPNNGMSMCSNSWHRRGVPSEATPGKENAPKGKPCNVCRERNGKIENCQNWLAAGSPDTCPGCVWPAPEVQGTPTKDNWNCSCSQGPCVIHDKHLFEKAASPVGTPQKETPPMRERPSSGNYDCPYSPRCGEISEGVQEIASCAYAVSTADYRKGAPMKTFSEFWETVTDSEIEDGIEGVANRAYLSGEAAGRRSAARAIKAVLENDAIRLTDLVGAVEKLCAELQEKTK